MCCNSPEQRSLDIIKLLKKVKEKDIPEETFVLFLNIKEAISVFELLHFTF